MITDENAEGNDRFDGYLVELVAKISEIANFKYTIYEQPDSKFGLLKDGEYDGMIGEVVSGVTPFHNYKYMCR